MMVIPQQSSRGTTEKNVTGDQTPAYNPSMAQTGMTNVLNKGATPQVYTV